MARLIVTAFREDNPATLEIRAGRCIILSVTDTDGNPVNNLTAKAFKIAPFACDFADLVVAIESVTNDPLPGFYHIILDVKKYPARRPGAFVVAFAVSVSHPTKAVNLTKNVGIDNFGQTIATVILTQPF